MSTDINQAKQAMQDGECPKCGNALHSSADELEPTPHGSNASFFYWCGECEFSFTAEFSLTSITIDETF